MHKYLLLLTLLPAVGFAQEPAVSPEGSDWHRVEALPLGVSIYVNARTRHQTCKLKTVDARHIDLLERKQPHVSARRNYFHQNHAQRPLRPARFGHWCRCWSHSGFAVGTKPGGFFGPNAFRGAIAPCLRDWRFGGRRRWRCD